MTKVTVILAACTVTLAANAFTIAEKGKTTRVSVPANPSACVGYAAEELARFSERITGGRVETVTNSAAEVVLDDTARGVPEQGFRLKVDGKVLRITSGADAGVLYGVYELLEKYGGCRWYTSWMEKIPAKDIFAVPDRLNDAQEPDFRMRAPFWWDFNQHADFAVRNRVNGEWCGPKAKHGGAPYAFAAGLGGHSFNIICPVKEYGPTHPEWFSKDVNGAMLGKTGRYCQLCLTQPELTAFVISNMTERIRKDPDKKIVGLMQNDNQHACCCPACAAIAKEEGSQSGPVIRFVNTVAEALEKEFPDLKVVTFAYQYTRHPPKKTKPRHNVMVELCSVECDFSTPIDQSFSRVNQKFLKDLEGWAAITDRLYVWDYATDFGHYLAPYPNVMAQQGNYRLFKKNKVDLLFAQGSYTSCKGDFAELKGWLQSKLMWSVDTKVQELLEDFFDGYYGKAAPWVRTYFDALHSYFRDTANEPMGIGMNICTKSFPDDFFDRSEMLWELAAKAVENEPDCYRKNVRHGMFDVWYAQYVRMGGSKGKAAWLMDDPSRLLARMNRRSDYVKKMMDVKRELGRTFHPYEWPTFKPDPFFTELASAETNGFPKVTAVPGAKRATIEETFIRVPGHWGETVDDPKAGDGRAEKLFTNNSEWSCNIPLDNLAVDEWKKFRVRIRVRVQLREGADLAKDAFAAGIYDSEARRPVDGGKRWKIGDIADNEYHWYDFAVWPGKMGGQQFVWVQPGGFDRTNKENPGIEGIYVDCMELEEIE